MSTARLSRTTTTVNTSKHTTIKNQFHRRNESNELDVFEAAKYYSGYFNNMIETPRIATTRSVVMQDELNKGGGRMSLDLQIRPISSTSQHEHATVMENQMLEKQSSKSKYKQPSSPGGRLATFLNSLFNQTSSKKKKKSTNSVKDDNQDPNGTLSYNGIRRKLRRSSISHFRRSSSETKSLYSSSSASGFRTPPPYDNYITPTPTKSLLYKNFMNKQVVMVTQHIEHTKKDQDSFLDAKVKLKDGFIEKNKDINAKDLRVISWADKYLSEETEFKKFRDGRDEVNDDGFESDSSSDLFELQNFDLDLCNSSNCDHGLPVYETTRLDSIKRGATILNGAS